MSPQYSYRYIRLIAFILAVFIAVPATAELQRVGPVRVQLIAEQTSIQPGTPFLVGLHVIPDKEWHVYWSNPGDAGMPPKLTWQLPNGFMASDIMFPAPSRIDAGPLAAYGYYGEALYPVSITPPADLRLTDSITILAKAEWLVCKAECLPGSASVGISLPVKKETPKPNPEWSELFARTRQRIPRPLPKTWTAQATQASGFLYLDFRPQAAYTDETTFEFFVAEKAVIEHAAEQPVTKLDDMYRMMLTRSPYSQDDPDSLLGVLAVHHPDATEYYSIAVPFGTQQVAATASGQVSGLLWALLFAFIGGLILNLMPCVLPVLSLKVLGLVQQAGQGRRSALSHGMFFTLGVVASFWIIVGIMLLLQAGGVQLGWGFQLQSPTFVMILAGFMFLFALSLFGVYEIGFLTGTAGSLNRKAHSGLSGAFVSGVTATLVATPCTAPFMGAALGYSLTQPPMMSFLIYTTLGLGMAAPYMVLAAFPALLKFVPRPGRWMETLKQALGFVLAATVIWLGWVLASQAGATAVVVMMLMLLLLSIAGWIYGRWGNIAADVSRRWLGRAAAAVILLIAFGAGSAGINAFGYTPATLTGSSGNGIDWQEFSQARLDRYLADGKAVFIDFTAAWCLSCQVNEQVAFSSQEVRDRFEKIDIQPLKADWTNRSEEIARALARYGRNSVPLYVLYGPDSTDPILLPEILTPGIVLEALDRIETKSEHR